MDTKLVGLIGSAASGNDDTISELTSSGFLVWSEGTHGDGESEQGL